MKRHTAIYLSVCVVCTVISAILIVLGYKFYRLPEMLIVSGSIFVILISVFLFNLHSSELKRKNKIAYAGRQYVKAKCLCKFHGKNSSAVIALCRHGILIQGESVDSELIPYETLTVNCLSKFNIQFVSKCADRKYTYDITLGAALDVKAILQALSDKHVSVFFAESTAS